MIMSSLTEESMGTKVKRVGADFRAGTIAYYGPVDKTVTKSASPEVSALTPKSTSVAPVNPLPVMVTVFMPSTGP